MAKVIAFLAAIAVVVGLVAMPLATGKTDQGEIGLVYGGGPFEGRHFQQVLEPGSSLTFLGWFDPMYVYPVTQRSYIISQTDGEGDILGVIEAPSSNNIVVKFEAATYFRLNTNKLRTFHELLGIKHQAWTPEGWRELLEVSLLQQIEKAFQSESRQWTDEELLSDAEALETIQANVGRGLKEAVTEVLGDEYFCGVEFIHGQPECPDFTFVISSITLPETVVEKYKAVRASELDIVTATNEVFSREQEANSIRKLNEALEEAGDQYVLLKAIESGRVNFWVIPSDTGLTLSTPDTRSAPAAPEAPTTTTIP